MDSLIIAISVAVGIKVGIKSYGKVLRKLNNPRPVGGNGHA